MRTLEKILEDAQAHAKGTFVAMDMSSQSKKQLGDFVKNTLKLPNYDDPSTYHATIIASSTPLPQAAELKVGLIQAHSDHYELFNTRAGTKCLVLKIKSNQLTQLNKMMIDQGGKSAFTEYNPHITICFDYKETTRPDNLPVPKFPLTFDHLIVKSNDLNYRPQSQNQMRS
jgi:hypothetical protein